MDVHIALILTPVFSLKLGGGGVILEYSASLNYTCGCSESHDDLAVAIWRNSSNIGHVPRESSKSAGTVPTEVWQRDNVQLSVVTGDEGRLGNSYMCLHL